LDPALPAYLDADEKTYCKRVSGGDSKWALMDRKTVKYGGGRSLVEFCDLYSKPRKTLVHIKLYAGSAPLSHLFAQALVSGETFKLERDFRKSLDKRLPAGHKLVDSDTVPSGYKVVLGIAKAGSLELPFFAK
jgi:uncharacterized protein (TIGR04141 family)